MEGITIGMKRKEAKYKLIIKKLLAQQKLSNEEQSFLEKKSLKTH